MAQILKAVDLILFDFHLDTRPLLSPATLNPAFSFLGEPNKYHDAHQQGHSFAAGALTIKPVSNRARGRNRFWRRYCPIGKNNPAKFWQIQLPFEVTFAEPVVLSSPGITVRVRPSALVTAYGWSTNLELTLTGSFSLDDLQKLTTNLLDSDKKLFCIHGQARNLPRTLSYFGSAWQKAVYCPGNGAPRDVLKVPRHLLLSIGRCSGKAKTYREEGPDRMTDAERAKLHAVLLGTPFTLEDLQQANSESKYLYTQFGVPFNFALTYFQHGSLLFLQRESGDQHGRRKSLRCLAHNLRHFSLLTLGLSNFLNEKLEETGAQELQESLCDTLISLRDCYTNQFCQAWFSKYAFLNNLRRW